MTLPPSIRFAALFGLLVCFLLGVWLSRMPPSRSTSEPSEPPAGFTPYQAEDPAPPSVVREELPLLKTFTLGAGRSQIRFDSKAPQENLVGLTNTIAGEVTVDLDAPSRTRGIVSFPASSLQTGNKLRDRHLAGRSWLHASVYPEVQLTIERLEQATRQDTTITGLAVGRLDLHGVTAPVRVDVRIRVVRDRFKVEFAHMPVTLAAHGIRGKPGVVGSNVAAVIDVSGTIYGARRAAHE